MANSLYYTKSSLLSKITYSMILSFQSHLCSSVIHDYVNMTCDYDMWQLVIVICNIMLTLISKSKNKKINENENEKRSKKYISLSSLTLTLLSL